MNLKDPVLEKNQVFSTISCIRGMSQRRYDSECHVFESEENVMHDALEWLYSNWHYPVLQITAHVDQHLAECDDGQIIYSSITQLLFFKDESIIKEAYFEGK